MITYFLNLWDKLRASFWFVPALLGILAIFLATVMPILDTAIDRSAYRILDWLPTTTDGARATLSALAGAMIAVTSTVFSITIVVLSLTSQQYGPRLLRSFMQDFPTRLTLAVFVATAVYCLLALPSIEGNPNGETSAKISLLLAVVFALLSMSMLIWFIHHVAVKIQAPHVVAAVATELDEAINRLFPERLGHQGDEDSRGKPPTPARPQDSSPDRQDDDDRRELRTVRSRHEGYIQAVNLEGLMHVACENQLVVELRRRPGNFIAIDAPLVDVWPAEDSTGELPSEDELADWLNDTFIVGRMRTPRQDLECAVNDLVEIAVRSLSPGINDPFTAINCIDRLGAALSRLAARKLPASDRYDDDNQLRVIAESVSFREVADTAFNQIRQYGGDSVAVTIRLLEAFSVIATRIRRESDYRSIEMHAQMVRRLGESFVEEDDRQKVNESYDDFLKALDASELASKEKCSEPSSEAS